MSLTITGENAMANANHNPNLMVRTITRGVYDLQKMRIQMGNRVTGNFKAKLGQSPAGGSEKDLAKDEKRILDLLRASYTRITDGVVAGNKSEGVIGEGRMPTPRRFKGDEIISTYTELVLVDQYMDILKNEDKQFRKLGQILEGIPIYDTFLKGVRGVGPAMAGVLISEIDIYKAEYPSSLWAYAGLDAVTIGTYLDGSGKEHTIPGWKITAFYEQNDFSVTMLAEGLYPVTISQVGRSRKDFCLVEREYQKKDGGTGMRNSITYNPFLKTKLMGVLGTSFLRAGSGTVDGKVMGAAKRLELAQSKGYVEENDGRTAEEFLSAEGHDVKVSASEYGQAYYNYKHRIENTPAHKDKTDLHRHNMALRYAVKRFLVDLYLHWRRLENLPVAEEYSIAKLGMIHGQAGGGKQAA